MRWMWLLIGAAAMTACTNDDRCKVVEEVSANEVGDVSLALENDSWTLDEERVPGVVKLQPFDWQDGEWLKNTIADRDGCAEENELYYSRWAEGLVSLGQHSASQILVSVDPELEGVWSWQAAPIVVNDDAELFEFWQLMLNPNAPETELVTRAQIIVGGASYPDGTEVLGYTLRLTTDLPAEHSFNGEGEIEGEQVEE